MKEDLLKFQLANKENGNPEQQNTKQHRYLHDISILNIPTPFFARYHHCGNFKILSVFPYPIFTQKPSIYLFSIIFIQEC